MDTSTAITTSVLAFLLFISFVIAVFWLLMSKMIRTVAKSTRKTAAVFTGKPYRKR